METTAVDLVGLAMQVTALRTGRLWLRHGELQLRAVTLVSRRTLASLPMVLLLMIRRGRGYPRHNDSHEGPREAILLRRRGPPRRGP